MDYNSTIGQTQRAMLQDRQPQQDVSGFGYGEYDLTDKAILFSEIYYSSFRSSEQNEQWGVDFYGDSNLDFGPVPATNYWNPFKIPLASVYYELPELGGVLYHGTIYTSRVVGGVKGEVGSLSYEAAATYFWNDQTDNFANFYSDTGLQAAINRPGPAALNPFCYGCNTPAQVAGIDVPATGDGQFTVHFRCKIKRPAPNTRQLGAVLRGRGRDCERKKIPSRSIPSPQRVMSTSISFHLLMRSSARPRFLVNSPITSTTVPGSRRSTSSP